MNDYFNPKYASVDSLREKARRRMPGFAFDYLDGGCFSEINLRRNTDEIRQVQLRPYYLRQLNKASMETELFGRTYSAPFGIAPIGLQGLMWPGSPQMLARAAVAHNILFTLSTVSTASIEEIAQITSGAAWFQLYHPVEPELRDQLIRRAADAGLDVLVLLCDTPTFAYRPKEIRNGLSIPPRMTLRNILQMLASPTWALHSMKEGVPQFKTMKPYIPPGLNMKHLGEFMNRTFSGRLNAERVKPIRDQWKGKLVIKGVATEEDADKAVAMGFDGMIFSNHGGRQHDRGESTIKPLARFGHKYKGRIKVMMDSGIRSGADVAAALASGADFTFLGRTFMYGVGAMGEKGAHHTINMLTRQLQQVMEQICCPQIENFPDHLIKD
ncbi:MAG: alpha-hydroxy-acid oxidizing protein [Phycisphaerales bacterium]|nr:alpha-hydroxy-acid oxidizing protein [Phycisphaerales bacterium]